MIPEIGVMIGFFILARLVPARWKVLSVPLGATAFVVAAVVVVDFGIPGGQRSDAGLARDAIASVDTNGAFGSRACERICARRRFDVL